MFPLPRADRLLRTGALLLAGLLGWATAHADTTALTDDKSVDQPTGWYTYTNVSAASIGTYLSSNSARLTDIAVYNATTPTFTVTMVKNSGSYAVPGWWWYYGQTAASIGTNLSNNNARLISIEPYSTSAGIRFAVVMVSNTGTAARNWYYGIGASSSSIGSFLTSQSNAGNPQRLTSLKSYDEGGIKKYVWTSVRNLGADAKSWEYWFNQSAAGVTSRVNSFGGRITALERQADGTYNFIQVKNSRPDNHYWRYYFGLTSMSQANEVAAQFGSRVMDVGTYVSGRARLYDVLMIDNANTETRRIRTAFGNALVEPNGLPNGQWGAYLKPLGSGATISLNGDRRFEPASAIKAVHNLALMRRVKAGTDTLSSALVYYNYPPQTGAYPCPDPALETTANRASSTMDQAKDLTMDLSDNRTARGIVLRLATDAANPGPSGIAALEDVAFNVGQMRDTFLEQDRHGCGHLGSKRNLTTLADFGRLYERVENGAVLGTGTHRQEFWQPMNGGALDPSCNSFFALFPGLSCVEPDLRAVVQEEGASLGKSSAQVNDFIARIDWRFKPGIYAFPCTDPYTPCSAGHIEAGADAGRLTLPRKVDGAYASTAYVFGTYAADLNLCDPGKPAGNSDSCAACPECTATTTRDGAMRTVRRELFRTAIRQALATF